VKTLLYSILANEYLLLIEPFHVVVIKLFFTTTIQVLFIIKYVIVLLQAVFDVFEIKLLATIQELYIINYWISPLQAVFEVVEVKLLATIQLTTCIYVIFTAILQVLLKAITQI